MIKKFLALALIPVLALSLGACTKQTEPQSLYGFPEPTTEIHVTYHGSGAVATYSFTEHDDMLPIMQWYYGLKLKNVAVEPAAVDGNEFFEIMVNGSNVFAYDNRASKAYLYVNDLIYEVKNPSNPPVDT